MKKLLAIIVGASSLAMALPAPAMEPPPPRLVVCGPDTRDSIIRMYGGHVVGRGVAIDGYLVELLVDQDGGWALITTEGRGMTCVPLVGYGMELSMPEER